MRQSAWHLARAPAQAHGQHTCRQQHRPVTTRSRPAGQVSREPTPPTPRNFLVAAGVGRAAAKEIRNARAADRPRLTLRADVHRPHAGLPGSGVHWAKGESTFTRRPPTLLPSFAHSAGPGQPGSPGRTRRTAEQRHLERRRRNMPRRHPARQAESPARMRPNQAPPRLPPRQGADQLSASQSAKTSSSQSNWIRWRRLELPRSVCSSAP